MRRLSHVRRTDRRRLPRLGLAAVLVMISVVLMAIVYPLHPSASQSPTISEESLRRLRMIDRNVEDSTYRRDAFGASWADLDSDGCNTRDEVLLATVDRTKPYRTRKRGRCRADMLAGTWIDIYTGKNLTFTNLKDTNQAQAIPIDHTVPLAGSYRYGAKNWTQQRRAVFANDSLNLAPTTAYTNRAKADKDPASWLPPAPGRCAYATRYIAVKLRYDLPVDQLEKTALEQLLVNCPN